MILGHPGGLRSQSRCRRSHAYTIIALAQRVNYFEIAVIGSNSTFRLDLIFRK
jgi:hypothetical protein